MLKKVKYIASKKKQVAISNLLKKAAIYRKYRLQGAKLPLHLCELTSIGLEF